MHRERRLDISEGGDDDAPDALDRIEGQKPAVALDQPDHHFSLARGPEGGAGLLALLGRDQPPDDLAALDQEAVHAFVDAVDLLAQLGKGRDVGLFGRRGGHDLLIGKAARKIKENIAVPRACPTATAAGPRPGASEARAARPRSARPRRVRHVAQSCMPDAQNAFVISQFTRRVSAYWEHHGSDLR